MMIDRNTVMKPSKNYGKKTTCHQGCIGAGSVQADRVGRGCGGARGSWEVEKAAPSMTCRRRRRHPTYQPLEEVATPSVFLRLFDIFTTINDF
jgi:hypothetical protein